jgi:hypothetical protein
MNFNFTLCLYTQLYPQLYRTCSVHTVEYYTLKSTNIHVLSSVQLGQSSDLRVKWRAKLEHSASVLSISKGCNLHVRQITNVAVCWLLISSKYLQYFMKTGGAFIYPEELSNGHFSDPVHNFPPSYCIKKGSKVHPCTSTEALYRPYCP